MKENYWFSLKLLQSRIFVFSAIIGLAAWCVYISTSQAQEAAPVAPVAPANPVIPLSSPPDFVPRDLQPVIDKVDVFFQILATEGARKAYPGLLAGSDLVNKKEMFEDLINQTNAAFEAFGNLEAFERVDLRRKGSRLVSVTYIGACTRYPIQWNFVFYFGGNRWRVLDVAVTSLYNEMIDRGLTPNG